MKSNFKFRKKINFVKTQTAIDIALLDIKICSDVTGATNQKKKPTMCHHLTKGVGSTFLLDDDSIYLHFQVLYYILFKKTHQTEIFFLNVYNGLDIRIYYLTD